MMRASFLLPFLLLASIAVTGCDGSVPDEPSAPEPSAPEPDLREHISVDHILIAVRGALPGVSRTPEEARLLASDLFEQLKKGADWETLKQQHSDDRDPGKPARGPYPMANTGVTPRPGEGERGKMVKAFGDVSFSLGVGELGLANYDPAASKFGFHIIKRVE